MALSPHGSNKVRRGWLLFLLLPAAGILLMHPDGGLGVDLCPLHRWTGLPCFGCGMTRSLLHLVRGHWRQSLLFHPFGMVFTAALIMWALLRRRACRFRPGVVLVVLLAAFLVFGLLRLTLVLVWQTRHAGCPPAAVRMLTGPFLRCGLNSP